MKREVFANKQSKINLTIYSGFILIIIVGSIYGNAISDDFTFLRVWDYLNIVILLLGIPFLFLQPKAKLSNFFEATISNKQRLLIPVLIGAVFGILNVMVFKIILHREPYTELPPFLQPFPYSCFLYFSGALEIEIFYRLIPFNYNSIIGQVVREREIL